MNFYALIVASYIPASIRYLYSDAHGANLVFGDFILPITLWRGVIGELPFHLMLIITLFYMSWFLAILGPGMFLNQIYLTFMGITLHEAKKKLNVKSCNSVNESFKEVMGRWWLLNWVFPMHWWFPAEGDGIRWPNHRDAAYLGEVKSM